MMDFQLDRRGFDSAPGHHGPPKGLIFRAIQQFRFRKAVPKDLRNLVGEREEELSFETRDPMEAAKGAHVINTDVWASMGQEQEQKERERAFKGFTVSPALMKQADKNAIFLHCLPAHRGEEVSAEVIDGPQSRVWDEAENRLHIQKAIMAVLMGGETL